MNPMADLPKSGATVRRDRVLSDEELHLAWNAAEELGQPFGHAIRLLILTGARREEIGALRWSEIRDNEIRLEGNRTKNGEPHTIPLTNEAMAILEDVNRIDQCTFVFSTTGTTPVSGWSRAKKLLDEKMQALLEEEQSKSGVASEIAPWRIHDLRRTVATGLQRLGFNLQVIEAVIGHVSGSRGGIVGVYQRYSFHREKRQALEAWSQHLALLSDPLSMTNVIKLENRTSAE